MPGGLLLEEKGLLIYDDDMGGECYVRIVVGGVDFSILYGFVHLIGIANDKKRAMKNQLIGVQEPSPRPIFSQNSAQKSKIQA